jgi:HEAT repeat protein
VSASPEFSAILPTSQVEELIRTLVKAQRAFQMYLPNNPVYHRASEALGSAFIPVWNATDELVLTVAETDLIWEDAVVYSQLNKPDSFAWSLYKDGMRVLTLRRGVEEAEIVRFLDVVNRVKLLAADAADDLLTLLWEQDFQHLTYLFAEPVAEGHLPTVEPAAEEPRPPAAVGAAVREEVAEETAKPRGTVDLDDFDSTLYFLDPTEEAYIRGALDHEYARNVRGDALATIVDVFELREAADEREDIVQVLEHLFPSLLNSGDFRNAAGLLRELRVALGRAEELSPAHRERLDRLDARLSEPAIVTQLLQALEEGGLEGAEEDAAVLLRELRPSALEALVTYLPRIPEGTLRRLLVDAASRVATQHPAEVLRVLKQPESEAAGGIVELAGRLKLEPAVPGLGEVLRRGTPPLRLAAVTALAAIASPGALAHLERALEDDDRAVRLAGVRFLGERGYRNALRRVEAVVLGREAREMDLTEKMAFFEAYGAVAGAAGIGPMRELLEPRGLLRRKAAPQLRACAALALGRIGTPDARAVLEAAAGDKDLIVRNAVNNALRGRSA